MRLLAGVARGDPATTTGTDPRTDPLRQRLHRWQIIRTWARLIREAESLWHVDVREMHRLGAYELAALLQEVPTGLRRRVNRWLRHLGVQTRLNP
ncbi:MAG: hypothetical protein VKI63_06490 [Cyanobium sp.]|nr:hypothetical protein [Cyanobium sp.]